MFFEADFILEIKDTLCCLLFLKNKIRREFVYIHKMYKEKVIKRKTMNLQMRKKINKAVEENILEVKITKFLMRI